MPIGRLLVCCAAGLGLALAVAPMGAATAPRFFPDDPLWVEPDTEDASGVEARRTSFAFDAVDNLLLDPGDPTPDVPAQNVNTLGEVPDSSWFTNRIGRRPMAVDEVARPEWNGGPADGPWTVVAARTDGRTPGFVIDDRDGQRWFIKFDPPGHKGMGTGSEVLVSRLMWALGYNVPHYTVVHLRADRLVLGRDARITPRGFHERRMRPLDVEKLLRRADREADGSYCVSASRELPGAPLGPFRFHGTRPDDPNDIVPHEHRRELRALRVFSAWVNHVELRAGNTLDTLVTEDGRAIVRHFLLDFGATLGSAQAGMRPWWEGHEYMYEPGPVWKAAASFGLWVPAWRKLDVHESPAIGRMPALHEPFDPDRWKPGIPNAAMRHMRDDDAFWAAQRVMAFTDAMIHAVVRTAHFTSEPDTQFIAESLMARRNAIGRTYLTRINPVVEPALSPAGRLSFGNAAVAFGFASAPATYVAEWARFDNVTHAVHPLGTSEGLEGIDAPAELPREPGAFVRVAISARNAAHSSWASPVHAYFRRLETGHWQWVGFERLPAPR
jgi:hypothetical protein